jgi:hypothetical protein
LQVKEQVPPLHTGAALATPVVQACPQPPQLLASVVASWHVPPQRICPEGHPEMHEYVPDPAAHTGVPPSGSHLTPHAPQLETVSYCTHCPLQSEYPALHANEHVPEEHTAVAFAIWVVHACPHPPQLFTSDADSTQVPSHCIGALDGQAATHP